MQSRILRVVLCHASLCVIPTSFVSAQIPPAASPVEATARPFLHPLFSDHAVLQRDRPVPVWGWTTPGRTVTVTFDEKSTTAKADAIGRWQTQIAPFPAGGPHTLTVTETGGQSVTRKDILFGEVWLCSGQSNMEWTINGGVSNGQVEKASANFPNIRLITIPKTVAAKPLESFDPAVAWQVCTPQTAGDFSAVAYFFGRKLHQELNVPIGLITAAWGGTVGEAWVSAPALGQMPDFLDAIAKADADVREQQSPYEPRLRRWLALHVPDLDHGAPAPEKEDVAPKTLTAPGAWEKAGTKELEKFDGILWLYRSVEIPAEWAGRDITLHLGSVADLDVTFWNGAEIGCTTGRSLARDYKIPGNRVKAGANTLATCIVNRWGSGGLVGKPGSLRVELDREHNVSLDGTWNYQIVTPMAQWKARLPGEKPNGNTVTVLFNAMIAPLVPYGVKGVIWYQGESNMDRPEQYGRLLPVLIGDWRARFGSPLPFYIVHLAAFMAPAKGPVDRVLPPMREAQSNAAATVGHSGIAVTTDIGDPDEIHPRNKQDVGLRLALNALAKDYGKTVEFTGPTLESAKVEGRTMRLTLDHAEGGLTLKGDGEHVFAIAGANRKWVWAKAEIQGNVITVSSPDIEEPAAVRFAWSNYPNASLYNGANLPAAPFRTDDWK